MADWFLLQEAPLRVGAGGAWWHGDEPLTGKVAALFARSVDVAEDGSYLVRLGRNVAPLRVDVTPYVVRSVHAEHQNGHLVAFSLHLSDGVVEPLAPTTLTQADDHALYCTIVRAGHRLPCRFLPGSYHALAMYITDATKDGQGFCLRVGDIDFPIGRGVPKPQRIGMG